MIWESSYWKEPLLASSKEILEIGRAENPCDDELGKLEYLVMTGFYSIRKLLEAETKLSSSTRDGSFTTTRHPIKQAHKISGKFPDRIFKKEISYFYDLEHTTEPSTNLRYICNQFIHSFVFLFSLDEKQRVEGVFFCSDHDRKAFCNHIQLTEISRIFELVGEDYPDSVLLVRNGSGDWTVLS